MISPYVCVYSLFLSLSIILILYVCVYVCSFLVDDDAHWCIEKTGERKKTNMMKINVFIASICILMIQYRLDMGKGRIQYTCIYKRMFCLYFVLDKEINNGCREY